MGNITSPWDIKYQREQPFMAFGSLMNAYGRMNEGKEISVEDFEKISDKLFEIATRYTRESFENAAEDENTLDLPIKKKI